MPCPNCQSDDWKLASLVYAEGSTAVQTATHGLGIGISTGGVGIANSSANTSGSHQTTLSMLAGAAIAPPPQPVSPGLAATFFGFLIAVLGGFLTYRVSPPWVALGFAGAMLFMWGLVSSSNEDAQKAYEEALAKREAAMAKAKTLRMCLRCGTFYQPDDSAKTPAALAEHSQP